MKNDLDIVGTRVVRSDSLAKVGGEARYTADLQLPKMLVAKVLRSPYPMRRLSISISHGRSRRPV
jgi:CO/xanthine dehydrogenase Mo-binding subunit